MFCARQSYRSAPLVAALALALAGHAAGAAMDFSLAARGSHTPYSDMVDAIPTAWTVYVNRSPMADPASISPPTTLPTAMSLAEGGPGGVLGHVVSLGRPNGATIDVWGVYDRLAAIPSPMVLYFHGFARVGAAPLRYDHAYGQLPWLGSPGGLRGEEPGQRGTSEATPIEPPSAALLVPEPGALGLMLIGLAAACRRPGPGRRPA